MPQIPTGQVQPGQNGAPALYGVDKINETIPFQERLMQLFQPQDYVTIKNIDDAPVYWQYLPAHAEHKSHTQDGMMEIITREQPQMWVIAPGETDTLVGASAYMALDVMYKNVTAKKTLQRAGITPTFDKEGIHTPKNFNFSDGGAQQEFIKQAYLGKAIPTFDAGNTPQAPKEEDTGIKSMAERSKEASNAGTAK